MTLESLNPATGVVVATYPAWSDAQVDEAIRSVAARQPAWAAASFETRAAVLTRAAALLRQRAPELARLMALEMGKPIAQGRAEAAKCAWAAEYFAEHARRLLADEVIATDAGRSFVRCEPLGVVLAVMPWNFPFWQVFRFAAPALMAGNAALLKHASNVTGCALAIENLLRDAGLPEDLFRALLIPARAVERVIANPLVAAVTLTGSEEAGRSVGSAAGRALKPSVLELGGSDPFVILADADLGEAARVGALARTQNSGQSCIAAKRFIVVEEAFDAFLERFLGEMRAIVVGDPLDESTQVGPLARCDLRDALHDQVQRSIAMGARVALGGVIPDGPGAFYPVTVLTDVVPGMPAFDEEIFGPVAAVIRARDIDDAVRLANTSRFGLGASVWTGDPALAEALVGRIEAGTVFVNGLVKSDPRLPFGGIKASGYGRELAAQGIREFVNLKTVWMR
jgi:succinate-semialdehyde dehydrogenase/glutarate-semialdehyde dehydrogenase